jgi:hypothetical protein
MPIQVPFFDYSETLKTKIILVECCKPDQNKLFRDTINKFHSYKKYTDSPTRNIRWLIYESQSGNHIGAIGLSSATISISCRDKYIGWSKEQRIKNLGMLANNSRCCFIRDNITFKNAGSMVLKQLRLEGAKRWKEKYDQDLILLETFVQPDREEEYNGHKSRNGSIYKADNWIEVGITSGHSIRKGPLGLWVKETGKRGELARTNPKAALEKYGYKDGKEYIVSKSLPKIMFIKPLVKNWKEILSSES